MLIEFSIAKGLHHARHHIVGYEHLYPIAKHTEGITDADSSTGDTFSDQSQRQVLCLEGEMASMAYAILGK